MMKQMAFYSLVLVSIASPSTALPLPKSLHTLIHTPQIPWFLQTLLFSHAICFLSLSTLLLMCPEISLSLSRFSSNVISLGKTSLISCLSPKLLLYSHVLHIKLTFQIHNRIQNYWSYGETGTLMHCWWEYKLAWSHWKAIWKCLMKMHMLVDFFSSFSWMLPL